MDVMKVRDVTRRQALLSLWDFKCVICGCTFHDITSVTFEHLVPKSRGAKKSKKVYPFSNYGPSHYNCNQFRQTMSLIEASKAIEARRAKVGEKEFLKWINRAVPGRSVPQEFKFAPVRRRLACMELPEFLPGMR